jgi:hypothetical protein
VLQGKPAIARGRKRGNKGKNENKKGSKSTRERNKKGTGEQKMEG